MLRGSRLVGRATVSSPLSWTTASCSQAGGTPSSIRFFSAKSSSPLNYSVIPKEDHGPFVEYSVIHTDRSLNLMSDPFQRVMRDLNQLLKHTYNADKVVIVPG
jgi:alanine-glyoxylate transaminase/serine-glyoxylate transaminase/serine-pyruvate transaminase